MQTKEVMTAPVINLLNILAVDGYSIERSFIGNYPRKSWLVRKIGKCIDSMNTLPTTTNNEAVEILFTNGWVKITDVYVTELGYRLESLVISDAGRSSIEKYKAGLIDSGLWFW